MPEIAGLFLAGLALFFSGLAGIKSNLSQFTGRRFRLLLSRMTHRPVVCAALGAAAGAITQSASAVAFIMSGLVTTGAVQLRRILPALAASNVGTVLLVFLASISLKLAVLYLIGITGILAAFDAGGERARAALGALFSVGMLFYGLDLMKTAVEPLPKLAGFADFATFLASLPFAVFFLGMFLRVLIQSSSAISVIAITLMQSSLLSEFQAAELIAGAGPGVALAAFLLSSRLRGVPRQVVMYQAVINAAAGTLAGIALGLEHLMKFSGILTLIKLCPGGSSTDLACLYLFLMVLTFFIGIAIIPIAPKLLERIAPTTARESLSQPKYLLEEALSLPITALELATKEQGRYVKTLPYILGGILSESERYPVPPPAETHAGLESLNHELAVYLKELVRRPQTADVANSVLLLDRIQDSLGGLERDLFKFSGNGDLRLAGGRASELYVTMTEALHTIVVTLSDVFNNEDADDAEFLITMTEDRGGLMERIRKSYMDHPSSTSVEHRSSLWFAMTLFERIVWQVHNILVLRQSEET